MSCLFKELNAARTQMKCPKANDARTTLKNLAPMHGAGTQDVLLDHVNRALEREGRSWLAECLWRLDFDVESTIRVDGQPGIRYSRARLRSVDYANAIARIREDARERHQHHRVLHMRGIAQRTDEIWQRRIVAPAVEHLDRRVQLRNPIGTNRHLTAACGGLNLVGRLLSITNQAD